MKRHKRKIHDHPGRIYSFPPIADRRAKTLILGSMPGKASLEAQQYYAYPRNDFWKILGALTGAEPCLSYAKRVDILKNAHIAVWDVLQSCIRPGSLDSDIRHDVPNDFQGFFSAHPHITHIFFNGTKAEQSFHRHLPSITERQQFHFSRLPSTSPAHASITYGQKLEAWRVIVS